MKFGFVLRFRDPPRGENVRQMWLENLVLPPLSVGKMTLRLYTALNYS